MKIDGLDLYKYNDLVTPDGYISSIKEEKNGHYNVDVTIDHVAENFVGYSLSPNDLLFNLKSVLGQLGIHSVTLDIELKRSSKKIIASIVLIPYGPIAKQMLSLLTKGAYIGKLFAADKERRVRNEQYLTRMFGRSDYMGRPLLSFGSQPGYDHLVLDKVDGRIIAFLPLENGVVEYTPEISSMLPSIALAIKHPEFKLRNWVTLHQKKNGQAKRKVEKDDILLVKTAPLHICTAFARVVDELLPKGYQHTSASVLQPDTKASGDIYELFGESDKVLIDIPIEFYTLEPYKEHVYFSDRDQLTAAIENPKILFEAFKTLPKKKELRSSIFIVKSNQLLNLKTSDWITARVHKEEFPDDIFSSRRSALINRYVEQQSAFHFLKAIQDGEITSQGILLTKYFPTPLLKRFLINDAVVRNLKGIYFHRPSYETGDFFSHEDRSLLNDLATHNVPVYWVDTHSNLLLQFAKKPGKDSGMFVPIDLIDAFLNATMIGVYGSNLLEGDFQDELTELLKLLKRGKEKFNHPLMNPDTPLALVTGGGPGAMSVGNQVATELDILSCANIVDFSKAAQSSISEQHENPYIQAKMTYSLDKLVERQAEFHLDLPIFVLGGIGTDFELCLEEVRRKLGSCLINPVLLFGKKEYWTNKISSRFQQNVKTGTIKNSEWISNCFYVVENAKEGYEIYERFFTGRLPIGQKGPIYPNGFGTISDLS